MNNSTYISERYNRKKLWYRIGLGAQQLINYPVLNLIWILCVVEIFLLIFLKQKLVVGLELTSVFKTVFNGCMNFFVVYFVIVCVFAVLWEIGQITARKDEANMELVFYNEQIIKNQNPILISKNNKRKRCCNKRILYGNSNE